MDATSHHTVAYELLSKCNLNTDYARGWCIAPDLDLYTWLHRYKRHRFSVLPQIYDEYLRLYRQDTEHNDLPAAVNKTAIAVSIVSHLYLDMFNGWILCWGIAPPAINVPSEIGKEYRTFNLLLRKDQSAVDELQKRTERVFEMQLPDRMSTDELLSTLINELYTYTPFALKHYRTRALKHISDFIGRPLEYVPLETNVTATYYNMLNEFYKEY